MLITSILDKFRQIILYDKFAHINELLKLITETLSLESPHLKPLADNLHQTINSEQNVKVMDLILENTSVHFAVMVFVRYNNKLIDLVYKFFTERITFLMNSEHYKHVSIDTHNNAIVKKRNGKAQINSL